MCVFFPPPNSYLFAPPFGNKEKQNDIKFISSRRVPQNLATAQKRDRSRMMQPRRPDDSCRRKIDTRKPKVSNVTHPRTLAWRDNRITADTYAFASPPAAATAAEGDARDGAQRAHQADGQEEQGPRCEEAGLPPTQRCGEWAPSEHSCPDRYDSDMTRAGNPTTSNCICHESGGQITRMHVISTDKACRSCPHHRAITREFGCLRRAL